MKNIERDFCLGVQGICTECDGCFGEHCDCAVCAHGKKREEDCVFCGRGFEPLIENMTQAESMQTEVDWLFGDTYAN